jgi:hypothetical protein
MPEDDRRHRYAQVLGAPRWNHASAHCACDRDDPDGRGFTTQMCRRNYDRAVRERDQRLDALLAMVDAEVAAASRQAPRLPALVAARARLPRPRLTILTLPRPALSLAALPRVRLPRLRLTPAFPFPRG